MNRRTIAIALVLFLAAWAQAAGARAEGQSGDTRAPPAKAEKLRVLVLDLKGGGLEPDQLASLTGYLTVSLSEYRALEVLSGADMRAMVELEGEKQALGCTDDTSCLAELAGALGARLVVFGQMAKLGSRYLMNLNLFDSDAGKAVGRAAISADSLDGLMEQLPGAVHKLAAPFLEEEGYAVLATPPTPPAPEAAPPSSSGSAFALVLPIGTLAFGAALAAGGLAWDVAAPSSHNKDVDGLDFVPVALYAAAGLSGCAGLGLFFFNPLAGE